MLSVIIPARNEIYLQKTIESVLANAEGEIEVITICDGYWPNPSIKDDPRVTLIHHTEPIGQRQAINEAARIAKGDYIMKLDAHCAVDKGFDVKLATDCEYDWTVVPRMYNLDIETWQPKLIENTTLAIRMGKLHDYMYIGFNDKNELRALYYTRGENNKWHNRKELIDDTMSCMGPGWFMHKKRFWELGGCDEGHGGWGQQGVEVSCKAWLSGGSLKVNKKTWFAHWFRQFPYKISGNAIARAREYSKDLWLNNKWEKQTRKFEWLVNKFNPPGWEKNKMVDFNKYEYYHQTISNKRRTIKDRFVNWFGVPLIKYPNDITIYQEIIFKNKPDFIIETGTKWGGSALFFAQMCDLVGHGQVVSVDVVDLKPPVHPRITYIIGRATSTETLARIKEMVKGKTVMVSLDSKHERSHVKRELYHYGKLVTKGQYMVVEDTNYPEIGGKNGPDEAVSWYLGTNKDFVVDHLEDKWFYSCNPGGYLRKVNNLAKPDNTIIYYTDNSLAEPLASKTRELLVKAACDLPIISVSQKPLNLGKNICLGEIGRSWLSLYKGLLAGVNEAKTKYVVLAEHDCLYTYEHLSWTPPSDDTFYYNHNAWLVWWSDKHPELKGMYSYWPKRFSLSQLICDRELLKKSLIERLSLLEKGYLMVKGLRGAGEPGVADRIAMMQKLARNGSSQQLQGYSKGLLTEYKSESFKTIKPNLDIRHGNNFTGPKRGINRTYTLPYWGDFRKEVLNEVLQN